MRSRGLRRSLTDFKRHPWLHILSISTITIALLILGVFFLCYRNLERMAAKTSPQVSGTIYLHESLSEGQIQALKEQILALDKVQKVIFKSKASVLSELQASLGGLGGDDMVPGGEVFPDLLEVQLDKNTGPRAVAILKETLSKIPEVAEVDFSDDWLTQFKKIEHFLKVFGFVLMVGTLTGCSFIIANFMGMRHQSRKQEIDIIRLMGAHTQFIFTPFLWEGIIEGAIGSAIALGLLYIVKLFFSAFISVQWASILGIREWMYLSPIQFVEMIGLGIAMAFMGSITVFLRFQENNSR